jgi:hypothetical protein
MGFPNPSENADLLRQDFVSLGVICGRRREGTKKMKTSKSEDSSPINGNTQPQPNGSGDLLCKESIHNQLFHAFLDILKFLVRCILPQVTHLHLSCNKLDFQIGVTIVRIYSFAVNKNLQKNVLTSKKSWIILICSLTVHGFLSNSFRKLHYPRQGVVGKGTKTF